MLGNLVENAAKYGGGRVFVTVEPAADGLVDILIEDDGPASPGQRDELFTRGARLDTTGKPGTGLGLAIVRDVAEIYGGTIARRERGPGRPARAAVAARRLKSFNSPFVEKALASRALRQACPPNSSGRRDRPCHEIR
jgi:signal transduction histidine kinase